MGVTSSADGVKDGISSWGSGTKGGVPSSGPVKVDPINISWKTEAGVSYSDETGHFYVKEDS